MKNHNEDERRDAEKQIQRHRKGGEYQMKRKNLGNTGTISVNKVAQLYFLSVVSFSNYSSLIYLIWKQ